MQANRLRQAENTLSGIAKRVLDAVPISEPWPVSLICTELSRTGSRVDFNIVLGCLNTHKSVGLVKEPEQQKFIRIAVPQADPKPLRVVHSQPETTMPLPAHVVKSIESNLAVKEHHIEREPLREFGVMAQRLREAGRALLMYAEDIERLGLECEERVNAASAGNAKLQAMRALLKSLNED